MRCYEQPSAVLFIFCLKYTAKMLQVPFLIILGIFCEIFERFVMDEKPTDSNYETTVIPYAFTQAIEFRMEKNIQMTPNNSGF